MEGMACFFSWLLSLVKASAIGAVAEVVLSPSADPQLALSFGEIFWDVPVSKTCIDKFACFAALAS